MLYTGTYGAFGELLDSTGSTDNAYGFAGEQFDSELDQYYLRARYYDQSSGRFTRKDSFEGIIEDPLTLHKYSYANTNPANYTDPTGLYSLNEFVTTQVIRGALAGAGYGTAYGTVTGAIVGGWRGALRGAIGGAATGALLGALGGGIIAVSAVIGSSIPLWTFAAFSVGIGIYTSSQQLRSSDPKVRLIGGINLVLSIVSGVFAAQGFAGRSLDSRYAGQVYIRGGTVIGRNATIPDGRYLYTVRRDGTMVYGVEQRFSGPIRSHGDLAGGSNVLAAGEIRVYGGKVTWVDNSSGHYKPSPESVQIAELILKAKGFWGSGSRSRPQRF